MSDLWKFSQIPYIEESTFNKVLERFYNFGISGLVRENVQNSLDGKLPGSSEPVIVKIETGSINQQFIPGLDGIKARINCLKGRNTYTIETIKHMEKKMCDEIVNYISFEDSNTKGLKGALNGQSDRTEDTWSIYAYKKGVHTVEEDANLESQRGGSHGIGKIASNAASDLYMMYFANCDEDGNQHLGGTVQLIEHNFEGSYYRSTGYFTDAKKVDTQTSKFYPFSNDFHEIFRKDNRGLKIIIPFLREQFNDEKEILKSVCDSFFVAILQKKLEVIINGKVINNETIIEYVWNPEYYIQSIPDLKEVFTPLYFETYMNQEPISLEIADMSQRYKFKLYFNYNDEIAKGRVAIIRTIGMKIEDKKINGNVNKPFNAVLMPESILEDAFIKSLENESHTQLSYDHIKDQNIQKNAKRFINNISREISAVIEQAIKKNNPTDGVMNTSDTLYLIENQFKQDLVHSTPTVSINIGGKDQTVVKINPEARKKRTEGSKSKSNKQNDDNEKQKRKKRRNNSENNEENLTRLHAQPEKVERVIISNNEFVKFDLSDIEELKKSNTCNISLSVVDGMGKEYANEFNIERNYEYAMDRMTGEKLTLEKNLIKNLKVNNGIVQIELKLKEQFNKALKFVYYVEV